MKFEITGSKVHSRDIKLYVTDIDENSVGPEIVEDVLFKACLYQSADLLECAPIFNPFRLVPSKPF